MCFSHHMYVLDRKENVELSMKFIKKKMDDEEINNCLHLLNYDYNDDENIKSI